VNAKAPGTVPAALAERQAPPLGGFNLTFLTSVAVVYVIGSIDGVQMTPSTWVLTGILAWAASLVFASFGLFMGYLLPSENVMQIISPVLGVFSLLGGLFIPIGLLPSVMQDIAPFMPTYGVAAIARFPLVGGAFDPTWLLSVVLWTAAFAAAAMILFRRDTRRTLATEGGALLAATASNAPRIGSGVDGHRVRGLPNARQR
jgi:ABC-type polysaccharide/polyol phosphate export permease